MKILFVSAVLPYPLRSGGQIRMYHLLRHMAKDHDITLCSFIRTREEEKYISDLSFCRTIHLIHRGKALQAKYLLSSLFSNKPWLLSTYDNEEMKRAISRELQTNTYDLIHIEPFYVYPSVPDINVPMVVCEHNIEYTVYQTLIDTIKMPFMKAFLGFDIQKIKTWERRVWQKASHIITVSESDHDVILQTTKDTPITVIPNGVDTALFKPNTHALSKEHVRCIFVGDFAWFPNTEALQVLMHDLWPDVRKKISGATLAVVGRNMPGTIVSDSNTGIEAIGEVADIGREFKKTDILLAPMTIGGGTKFKILEAMATGVIVITTKEGALGLPVTNRKELFIVKKNQEYVTIIQELLKNPALVSSIRKNARLCVGKNFSWEEIAQKLDRVWRTV